MLQFKIEFKSTKNQKIHRSDIYATNIFNNDATERHKTFQLLHISNKFSNISTEKRLHS